MNGLGCVALVAAVAVSVWAMRRRRGETGGTTTLDRLMSAGSVDEQPADFPTLPPPSPALPPVPPSRPRATAGHATDALAGALDDQPLKVRLTKTEVDLRLRDIEAAEGWAVR